MVQCIVRWLLLLCQVLLISVHSFRTLLLARMLTPHPNPYFEKVKRCCAWQWLADGGCPHTVSHAIHSITHSPSPSPCPRYATPDLVLCPAMLSPHLTSHYLFSPLSLRSPSYPHSLSPPLTIPSICAINANNDTALDSIELCFSFDISSYLIASYHSIPLLYTSHRPPHPLLCLSTLDSIIDVSLPLRLFMVIF
jgi:hypothetical protein